MPGAGSACGMLVDLQTLYDDESGMFLAASVDCRQIDICGSAYAAYMTPSCHSRLESAGTDGDPNAGFVLQPGPKGNLCRPAARR